MESVRLTPLYALGVASSLALASVASAGVISDTSYFNAFPTTLINFETDGVGTPITLIQAQSLAMPLGAYSNLGVTFVDQVNWVNDGTSAFDAAQTIGGSPVNSIPSASVSSFRFDFTVPIYAFGFFVINNAGVDPNGPRFVAKDSLGNVLDTAQFGAGFADGQITVGPTTASYGFMGIFSNTPIARVEVTKQAAILDDLRFTSVPTPGVGAVVGLAAAGLLRRRRNGAERSLPVVG